MKRVLIIGFGLFFSINIGLGQHKESIVKKTFIEHILNNLASDDMRGRHAFTADAERAADFIAAEFKEIGLQPYANNNFKQSFVMNKVSRVGASIQLGKEIVEQKQFLILGMEKQISWNQNSKINTGQISKSDDFATKFRTYANSTENIIVQVDPSFASYIERFNKIYGKDNVTSSNTENSPTRVFIITESLPADYQITCQNDILPITMSNVAGIIPGTKNPNEFVVFSGHYDHIGILKPDGQDSIANGADDDASGIAAMISLAKYYKSQANNARTLIFVAFTGEEVGMYGSKYFSNNINADSVVAMINIEMIGKGSKFGPNSMYITGYERSDLGKLMQLNLKGSSFTFHPDPYSTQKLFYRSDNAVLAALGVPAHTFSTSQIDKDQYYHTVKDEISTLDIENIKSSIEAIAIGAKGIVDGTQTPSRVEKLKD